MPLTTTSSTSLTSTASSHSLPGSLAANDGDSPHHTVKVTPLTETNDTEKLRDKPTAVKIVRPELNKKLLHPEVDSYADAPRVPGQPTSTSTTPLELPYIKDIRISDSDRQTNLRLKRENQAMGGTQYANTRGCYTIQCKLYIGID